MEKEKSLDKYVTLVIEFIKASSIKPGKDRQKEKKRARQRMERRRALLLQEGISEKELEAAYLEAVLATK